MEWMITLARVRKFWLPCQEGWAGTSGLLAPLLQSSSLLSSWSCTLNFLSSQDSINGLWVFSMNTFFFFSLPVYSVAGSFCGFAIDCHCLSKATILISSVCGSFIPRSVYCKNFSFLRLSLLLYLCVLVFLWFELVQLICFWGWFAMFKVQICLIFNWSRLLLLFQLLVSR